MIFLTIHHRHRGLASLAGPPFCLLALLAGCSSAPRPENARSGEISSDDLDAARTWFYRSVSGDREALSRATVGFETAHQRSPSPVVTAYLGACRLLNAAAATWPWEKGRLSKEGVLLLEEAVSAAPDDLEIRFVRGMTSYRLPRFMGRRNVAIQDLARVAAQATQAARDGRLPRMLAAAALYHHGLILQEEGDNTAAIAAWREAVAVDPTAPGGQAAARQLQQMERE